MTVFRNDDQWDRSNVEFADGRIVATTRRAARRTCATSTTGSASLPRGAFAAYPPTAAVRSGGRVSGPARATASWPATKSHERFYEIGSPAGLEDTRAYLARGSDRNRRMTYTRQHLDEAAQILDALDADAIERMADAARRRARARRPAVLPRRRRQRRQLLARGQRLPQDRRLRGLRADRQRLRADRAHQRRRLGRRVFVAWLRAAGCAPTDGVFVFSVGGGSLEKNISPNLVRALEYAKAGRRRASSASSAATAATPRRSPTPASSCRPSIPTPSRRTPRRFRPWSGTCWCRIPRSRRRRRSGNRHA